MRTTPVQRDLVQRTRDRRAEPAQPAAAAADRGGKRHRVALDRAGAAVQVGLQDALAAHRVGHRHGAAVPARSLRDVLVAVDRRTGNRGTGPGGDAGRRAVGRRLGQGAAADHRVFQRRHDVVGAVSVAAVFVVGAAVGVGAALRDGAGAVVVVVADTALAAIYRVVDLGPVGGGGPFTGAGPVGGVDPAAVGRRVRPSSHRQRT